MELTTKLKTKRQHWRNPAPMTPTTSGEMHNDEFTPAWTKDISFQLGKALSPADDICRVGESGVLTLDSDTKKTADCTPVAASSQRARFQAAGFDSGHASWGNASNTYAVSASVAYWIGYMCSSMTKGYQWYILCFKTERHQCEKNSRRSRRGLEGAWL